MKTGLLPAIAINSVAMLISSGLYFSDDANIRELRSQPELTRHQETFQQRATRTRAAGLINRVSAPPAPE